MTATIDRDDADADAGTAAAQPIIDAAWTAKLDSLNRSMFSALAELFSAATTAPTDEPETAEEFTARCLGVPTAAAAVEDDPLGQSGAVATALALAEWLTEYDPEIGPAVRSEPPAWTVAVIGEDRLRHPRAIRAHFPAGTVAGCDVVLGLQTKPSYGGPSIVAITRPEHRDEARAVLDKLAELARRSSPYRGRVMRASMNGGLTLEVIELPETLTRSNIIVPQEVWDEVDLSIRAVRDEHEALNAAGLGVRRGVMLAGPPGCGKSAVSGVIARELHAAGFTVVFIEARAGASLLTELVQFTERIGGPTLLVLDDVDIWVRERARFDSGLSELLLALEIEPGARILTLASTNDVSVLDRAAIRTGRFDSIIEIGPPDTAAAAQIMVALLAGLPCGGAGVDTAAVAAALPPQTSGSDIREIVRRAVLSDAMSTAGLIAEVGAGRYRPAVPTGGGTYL